MTRRRKGKKSGGRRGGGKGGSSKRGGSSPRGQKVLRLPAERDRAIAAFLGVAAAPLATLLSRIADASRDIDRLRAAVGELDFAARVVLYELIHAGGGNEDTLVARLGTVRGVAEEDVRAGVQALRRHTLAEECAGGCGDLHPRVELSLLSADALAYVAGARDGGPEPLPFEFRVALVAAYCAQVPPGLTKQGRIYVRWLRNAVADLAHPSLTEATIEMAFGVLLDCGALTPDAEQSTRVLHLDVGMAASAVTLPPSDLALGIVYRYRYSPLAVLQLTLAALRRAEQRREGSDTASQSVSLFDMQEEAGYLARLPWRTQPEHADGYQDLSSLASGVHSLWQFGLVEVTHDDDGIRVHAAAASHPPREQWSVLPNLDVLVPAACDPADVVRLGRVARIASVDRVTRFVLDRSSAQRAAATLDGDQAVALLASGSAHEMPENVAANLMSWLGHARPVSSFVGAVVVASGDEQGAVLLRADPAAFEIAPGVYAMDPARLPKALRALAKAGNPVLPTQRHGMADAEWDSDPVDLVARAGDARSRLDAWATVENKAARATKFLPYAVLRHEAPWIWAAARADPELLDWARSLGFDELKSFKGASPDATRSLLRVARATELQAEQTRDSLPDALATGGPSDELYRVIQALAGEFPLDTDTDFGRDDEFDNAVDAALDRASEDAEYRDAGYEDAAAPWETLSLGPLRKRLNLAADRRRPIDLIYKTTSKGHEEVRVLPKLLTAGGGREILIGQNVKTGNDQSWCLDLIVAVRDVEL